VFYNLLQNIILSPKEREKLVTHPLIESFINFKWCRIKRIIQIQVYTVKLSPHGVIHQLQVVPHQEDHSDTGIHCKIVPTSSPSSTSSDAASRGSFRFRYTL
jgi:hypothetical protein